MVIKDLGLGSGFWTGPNNDTIKKYKRSARFGSTDTKIGMKIGRASCRERV